MSYDKVQVGSRIRGSRLEKGCSQEQLNRVAVIVCFQAEEQAGTRKKSLGLFECLAQRKGQNHAI